MQNTTRSKEHHNSKPAYQPSYSVSQTPKGLQSQEKVYQFLRGYIAEYGYAPSVRDICVGTGLTSTSSVYLHLRNLAKAGLIRKTGNQPRCLVLVEDYDLYGYVLRRMYPKASSHRLRSARVRSSSLTLWLGS